MKQEVEVIVQGGFIEEAFVEVSTTARNKKWSTREGFILM